MATVQSLGLHQPSGLQYAIDEQLLLPNAPPSSYTWTVLTSGDGQDYIEDELLTTDTCVIWSRGGLFRKCYKFHLEKETITQALIATFPVSEDEKARGTHVKGEPKKDKLVSLEKALVVFLKTQAHIYFLSGTSHIIHMPFEVESACAGPIGVIIQRKQKTATDMPIDWKFPRVPPNSFVSSQLTAFNNSQNSTFSFSAPGKVKPLNIGLGSTLENMWDAQIDPPDSHWPRLVSLTDPLLEIGLVVTEPDAPPQPRSAARKSLIRPNFLSPAEELLHLDKVDIPGAEGLVLAVTVNRDASTYSIWRLTYMEHEDPFIGQVSKSKAKTKANRRRSSMAPGLASGTSTPAQPNYRESFGAPMPGKRPRRSEKVERPVDLVSSLEQQDKADSGVTRRSSRRVSSMLARADLSASHERSVFTEQQHVTSHATSKRHESLGNQSRLSSSQNHQLRPSLGSLLEAPFDVGLDEGFHNMGLDDHDFDGLQQEVMFTKIHSFSLESSNLRYSAAEQTTANRPKVFVLMAPPFASNERSRGQLLVGIQDPVDRRLQLITLHIRIQQKFDLPPGKKHASSVATVSVLPGDLRRAQNVVDSCKLVDGEKSAIVILSESMDGHHELSAQAPWSELAKISLSVLFVENTRSLMYRGRKIDRDVRQRKSELIDLRNGSITGIRYPRSRGIVDVVDADGRLHQLKIQLEPTCPQVRKVLSVCSGILPDCHGERVHAAWLHMMQWFQTRDDPTQATEWSCLITLLLATYLNLGRVEGGNFPTRRLPVRHRATGSGQFSSMRESDDWRALEMGETGNSLMCPPWMLNKGWEWAMDEGLDDHFTNPLQATKFIPRHISFAKEFMASEAGDLVLGPSGYMPTSLGKNMEARKKAAVDIFMALHLLLEEQKLNIMTPEYSSPGRADLRAVLCQIARWLKWNEFWTMYEMGLQEEVDSRHDSELNLKPGIPPPPQRPDVFHWIQSRLVHDKREQYVIPADIFYIGSRLPESEKRWDDRWDAIVPRTLMFKRFFRLMKREATAVDMVEAMYECGMTPHFLATLPEAILVPLQDAISLSQPHPPSSWSTELLDLVKRTDISLILTPGKRPRPATSKILTPTHVASWDYRLLCQSVEETNTASYDEGEGTERQAVIRALFKDDRRLNEVQDLLSTHKSRLVRLDADPTWPESLYLEKQKELVSRIATGTLAIPSGRGLLYYNLRYPLITQKFHIGGFNLNCVVKPANVTVGVDKSMFTEEKVCWGFFHQGVAAGLAISPQAKGIDTSWILYNKPGQDLSNRHAGFLLALGLNGHLKDVAKWVAFKYLTPKHTMTSIGLLLGLAASYMGTMDSLITRLLSVHVTRMLPRGAAELNLSHLTQTSGIMGIGLLYYNSQHRRMSEIMLSEIEHIDEEDEEEPLRSECYRLAAGFALGLINLAKGNDLKGLHDLRLTEKLISLATATKKVELVHILDRAAAGAVMAIALIFMKSEDQIVARKIGVPASVLQFDYIRPDILLLRTVARNMILWSKIEPTYEWVQKNLPSIYRSRYRLHSTTKLRSIDLPFFSILTGLCFSIALRHSGSASTWVRDMLLHYLDQFMRLTRIPATGVSDGPDASPPYDEELARTYTRMCQDVLALSVSIVMAGTGDIPVLRRLRSLHGRHDAATPYGSHLATHLAIGALFLGCGTATFGSSNVAIAALLISFYPIFPNDVMDNRSHLQAFRHFWVLAVEQRCLVTKDIQTGQPVPVSVHIKLKGTKSAAGGETTIRQTTPCLLPPLDQIARLSTDCGPQFWNVELDFANADLKEAFSRTQSIHLRRRPPGESAFSSTLRALGSGGGSSADPRRPGTPLEWVFGLAGLRGTSYAERATILENSDERPETARAVDARLEMERGVAEGGDRERLEGARLLFEWGGARDRLLGREAMADSQATIKVDENGDPEEGDLGVWWMRDGVVEALRGRVMMAAREVEN